MPVSPEMAVDLAKRTLEIFLRAEQILLELVARLLARGGDTARPEADLLRIQRLRRDAQAVVDRLLDDAVDATEAAVRTAYNRGVATAGGQLADLGPSSAAAGFAPVGDHAVRALVEAAASRTRELVVPIVRVTEDAYRQAVVDAAAQVVVGTRTRRDASAEVVSKLAEAGLQFVDSRGRRWEMGAYAEMAVRTTAGQALVQGHLDRLREAGHDLVVVSDAPEECLICRPWEQRILSISGRTMGTVGMESPLGGTVTVSVRGSMAEAVAAGLFHPNCFPGDVPVSAPSGVRAADSRWYEGELVVIHTASGDELPVTPKHPVLTPEGWVAAGSLHVGQRVIRYNRSVERMNDVGPHNEQIPTRIGEVFHALRQSPTVLAMRVPASAKQFHGDGEGSDVNVVLADSLLQYDRDTALREAPCDRALLVGGVGETALLTERSSIQVGTRTGHSAYGSVSGRDLRGTLLCRHGRPLPGLSFAARDTDTAFEDPSAYARLADAEGFREVILALAGAVTLDEVIHIGWRQFSGHVYNLQARAGWYVASGIVVHNCRHTVSLYIPGVTPRPLVQRTADPQGDELRRRQRALERAVRTRRRQLGALAVARKETAAALGRKTLPLTDPVEREYRRVRALEQAARVRHDAFIAAHDRKALTYRFNPVHR